jgi:hypothetical protein
VFALGEDAARDRRDLHQDRRDLRQDRVDRRNDRADIRSDRRDLSKDRRDLRKDLRSGDYKGARSDKRDIRSDRRDLRETVGTSVLTSAIPALIGGTFAPTAASKEAVQVSFETSSMWATAALGCRIPNSSVRQAHFAGSEFVPSTQLSIHFR